MIHGSRFMGRMAIVALLGATTSTVAHAHIAAFYCTY